MKKKPRKDPVGKFLFAMVTAATMLAAGLSWFLLYLRG
jgi:hypothetical protein